MTPNQKLELITYSHYYYHQMKMSEMASRIVVTSQANTETFQTLASYCTNAVIIQK